MLDGRPDNNTSKRQRLFPIFKTNSDKYELPRNPGKSSPFSL